MQRESICPVCRGTGKERHEFTRGDGERVVEEIRCELCNGIGRIKCESNCYEEDRFRESNILGREYEFGGYRTFEEDEQ